MSIVHKTETRKPAGRNRLTFVLSDATVDRYGDTIDPHGWDLSDFRNNPIALFGHDGMFPVGKWANVRVEKDQLLADLIPAQKGTSARIDEIVSLVEQDILRTVSVGFKPIEYEPRKGGGINYKKQSLLECSVVGVPANPAALAVAKSLHVSPETMKMAFGEQADEGCPSVSQASGEHAAPKPQAKKEAAMTTPLSKRIEDAQNDLVREKDALTAHLAEDDADPIVTEELSARIEQKQAGVDALKRAEAVLATKAVANPPAGSTVPARVAKKSDPKDALIRSAVCRVLSHVEKRSPQEIMVSRYGEDEAVKTVLDVVTRAASVPATTTQTGWAAELVQTAFVDFMDSLLPKSVYAQLRDRGGRFGFGRNGIVTLPSRNVGTSIAGSFVAQGNAIPVRQAAFNAITLNPKKMAVITTFTREIAEHSTPSIEAVLKQAMEEDTTVAVDTILLDNVAASPVRPAGLRNGVSAITPTVGGGFNALVIDIKALVGALITASNGNLRQPVFIMNPVQALSISLTQNAGGDFPFAAGIERQTLNGYPVITSSTVPVGTVYLIDAADFFTATGDEPRFDVSDQATLHMEDTAPTQIGTAGTPNAVAAPVRSMFQTDSLALRMIIDMNWAMRRSGVVAVVTGVTW